ncbi:DUF4202 domain-containing protein [Mucilaginibacter paludis]|uniref:DUF4202 domain-containing protein n=1 Tax=Mucilaginibacter paludis DSM 18603 TaxID=714943 RepID=H1Y7E9_9SPHI|nr:DUF4202 domain-containing protein [Mucilaginibacter paludis]EHQ29370.1 hypothetical protein Mucpa_5295 [Mucilaginibacter paludis DSM 18603]
MEKLEKAFALFDAYNKQDPKTLVWDGVTYPEEYFYAIELYNWVLKLEPKASEPVLLASRSQHIGRWTIPRDSYPDGKAGYLNWRSNLAKFHATKAGELMEEAGYDTDFIEGVQKIILKQKIKLDPEVQLIENALCLVFLQFQFESFIQKHAEDKLINIVRKTWKKMSQAGHDAALKLTYSERAKDLIGKALG